MKIRLNTLPILAVAMLFAACDKDNYPAPQTKLAGQIVYQGEPIGVEYGQVRMQLWQPGFGKLAAIDAPVDQDGSYSAVLFNGNYKLVFPGNEGPWKTISKEASKKDTLFVNLSSDQQLDIEVMPYYMIRNEQFTGGENKVNATIQLDKIITGTEGKDIERVSLYISKTQFVARANNIGVTNLAGSAITNPNAISLSVNVPSITPSQNYVFARVGVKIAGVEDMLFSEVQKVTF
jgi:hypothetical protein